MKKNQLHSGFILSYIAIFVQSAVSIIYTPVMLRFLGESYYGLLQIAISTIANLGILSFGFGSSYLRFYSKYKALDDEDSIASLNGMFTMIFSVAAFIALIAGGVITANTQLIFAKSLTGEEIDYLRILLGIMTVNLALSLPFNVFDSYIISQERFSFQKLLLIAASLLNPILTLPLFLMGRSGISVAISMTVITAVKLIASILYCIKRLHMKFRFEFDTAVFKQLCMFSFFIFLNIISDQINWNADKTILGIFKGSANVTAYSVGSQFNNYYLTFSYALLGLFSPRAYKLVASGADKDEITGFFAGFGRIQFVVMAYIFIALIALGKPFIRLWSGIDSDVPYYTAVFLISPLLLTSVQSIGIEIQRAKDMHRFRSVLYIFIAFMNIGISIPLCIKYGELGCAFGTSLSLVIGNIIIMNIYNHRRVGLNIFKFWREILKFIPALIAPVAAVIIIRYIARESVISIAVCAVALTVVYFASMWFFGLSKNEKELIKNTRHS